MRTAVITTVSGRGLHLRRQRWGLAQQTSTPDLHVVVAMDDPTAFAACDGPGGGELVLVEQPLDGGELPLAAARNAGAAAALDRGADVLVFLDVDCIPSRGLVGRYRDAVRSEERMVLHCGTVNYLSAAESELSATGFDIDMLRGRPHPARPEPTAGSHDTDDWQLFWSLSFAVSATTWRRLGGFDERFAGYGGEDTDLGLRAHLADVPIRWWSGASASHQYHPSTQPPVQHLDSILRNANLFRDLHGFFPMTGWLEAFAAAGLARHDPVADRWTGLRQVLPDCLAPGVGKGTTGSRSAASSG
ncbi:glycosyltransferase family 2 protein [Nakamurella sp. YIM 132087]|uniref:Glycosyltransferase family 2 protein n=1 Tax=Nakamurella alba TaxID=2665158 RepID=A0A7K1FMZ4_9ACTN|nr:galactosyltransferase-related protein [Nakamurella alba]MTD14603.1 glycosyltransferase family 2 protein [Nakamurella alba]